MDYRHHATDIIAGGLLGSFVAVLTYHLCEFSSLSPSSSIPPTRTNLFPLPEDYPSLLSPQCHLPFSPRIPAVNASVSPNTSSQPFHDSASSLEQGHEIPLSGGHDHSDDNGNGDETCPRPQGGSGFNGTAGGVRKPNGNAGTSYYELGNARN